MIRLAPALLPLAAIACAPVAGQELGVQCNADRAQSLVGREATPAAIERAKQRTGARTVRVIKPGEPVTMDFRSDRLNVEVDNANTVAAVRCG